MSKHQMSIIDFARRGQSIYIVLQGYDAQSDKPFAGEVRILGNNIYGDMIHPNKSLLSESCRKFIKDTILIKLQNQEI
ncbi:hypothetical protein MKX67_17695 [Cytobacillus sp. FSL W7-1323]|uniref:hypothetical protein n=1 Tax=Cytobacillus TaxID=2675230 RepID=UPI002789B024|nr:hypothetical protein [Cytobacillus kochii]MDQ0186169.1 hypothetical protein [Cytobacillus kochii]MED1605899.1 hypothetical protein [Cytobacillus kochii]